MGGVVKAIAKVAIIAVGVVLGGSIGAAIAAVAVSALEVALAPKAPKVPASQRERLYATIDPSAPRKIAFGSTALATDIRYEEWSGANQDYLDRIIAVASHAVEDIEEIWIDDQQAWTSGGGVTATYSGYLTVATRLEGTSANTIAINGGAKWGSSRRLTGCAYIHMRFKTTGNSKKAESPFASSIPQRLTVIGKGAKLYDPRLDSTVGGSGAHRADDQTTWAWSSDTAGNNPALQILFYLLGWQIGGRLAIGRGIPPARIDMAAFIAAANLCEESVALAAGGTEPRYQCAGVVSESDDPLGVIENLMASCAGTIRDAGGSLALTILHNDLASPVAAFTDDDVLGNFDWQPDRPLQDSFNVVRGRRPDPSTDALYQMVDYPAVSLTSPDGLERIHSFDLAYVQSGSQAQRLAKQELQRAQYPGTFSAQFKATAWRCQVGDVVTLTFSALGFSAKLFRVMEQIIRMTGVCDMVLREENAAIYAWSAEESPSVVAAAPTVYDPLNSPLIQGIAESNTAIEDALAYAASRGKMWTGATRPAVVDSEIGDTWLDPSDGTLYERVDATGISIGGSDITIGGSAVFLAWTWSANQAIRDALATANSAYTSANDAIDQLIGLADDGILSVNEKITKLIPDQAQLDAKYSVLAAQAAAFSVSTTAAAAAKTTWDALLASLSPAWNDTTADSTVTRTSFDAARNGFDQALADLDKAIKDTTATLAAWAGVSGAPSSTPAAIDSGTVAANAGVNSDGTIKTDKVDTPAIVANAVTNGAYFSTASALANSTSSFATACSLTVTPESTSSKFLIMVNVIGYDRGGGTPAPFEIQVTNVSSLSSIITNADSTNAYSASTTVLAVITGLSSSTTFDLKFRKLAGGSDAVINSCVLVALELKK